MSGWWSASSAASASRPTNAIAAGNDSSSNSFSSAPSVSGQSIGWSIARKPRQGRELLCEYIFRPVAQVVAVVLAPLGVPPPAVVLANFATGLAAACLVASGHLVWAAVLLQAKTVLDNADGQLARMTGRTSALGRYLDSECDLVSNAAVCAALGYLTHWWVGAVAYACLTFVLSVNYNAERLYRRELGEPAEAMPAATGLAAVLARFYALVYAPQDRLVERYAESRLRGASRAERLAWHDRATVSVVANFGLTTQLFVLGACLAAGSPAAYAWVAAASVLALIPLALRRERLRRR
jgi:archaetidylinositol phosphate synthase